MKNQQICIGDILEPFEEILGERPEPEILTLTEKNGFVAQRQKYKKRIACDDTSNYKVVRRSDIALNPYLLWAGAIAQNVEWDLAIISPLYPTFHVRNGYDSRFVDYLLRGDFLCLKYDTISFGSVPRKRRASVTDFLNLKLPKLPSLPKQQHIAEILGRVEALQTKRRAVLAQLDELNQAIFFNMFGDPIFNPQKIPRIQLINLCTSSDDIKCGPFGTQLGKDEYTTEGVPLWGIKHVNALFKLPTQEFLEAKTAKRLIKYSIEPGDIVMTRKGTIGNCAVYPEKYPLGIMHSDLLRLRINLQTCDPIFLSHQLHYSRDVERQLALISGGAVMPGINVTKLKSLEVLVPPLDLQKEFAHRIEAVEKLKATHRTSLSELDELFAFLQYRGFRGEL
jgi:type I restriction enzyme S subunit